MLSVSTKKRRLRRKWPNTAEVSKESFLTRKYLFAITLMCRVGSDRTGGFLLISLLQDFVLDSLLKNFTDAESPKYEITIWMIEIPKISGGSHFQRYLIHFKPAAELSFNIRETFEGEATKLDDVEAVKKFIQVTQV